ncbi:hypothetical protein A2673_01850 [Candidatus Kaiserbacteria bacterium RIFCSPHIGHO2_01_FULL_50_13]|uniref:Adenylate kinase n=1 Tax=Candidatus Kaiserbacteria bacterium RIFCSPLOWO2_01_FULL_50_24 TaxID=1798507 RepID=A0A1F6EIG5_9BACT|nr:MAG: hypothetical protein A2673_01850 [Candidatus Kaiserbacteria bacterium RIFCSPHIGHO2_01_FULL_50_13]OGG73433.1 MAG: hypothetical protein A3A34_02425 [Candidatus Kaiserbacteria bacterium RIFCSPLOWO2_01_FULL_50_24]OGG81316.1 MAG: hypothetical protein A3H74_02020 [Candidatus Kaiserbacteria bacterium RIFCSPLOWO2_02_FULL_51_13]
MLPEQPLTTAFFGVSGAGKGTQAELLENYLRAHDSAREVLRPEMGKLARAFMDTGTAFAEHAKRILARGGLLPSFIPIYLLTTFLNEQCTGSEHVILDGVSRRAMQAQALDEMMRLLERKPLRAIVLNVSMESAKQRLLLRGRYDDTDEAIEQRFSWYEENVVPSYQELEKLGWNVFHIDGEPDIETIHKNILSVLGLEK